MRVTPYKPRNFNDFWENRVEQWLLNDVKKCVENRINIGGTTLIFCYMDFLGSLLKPKSTPRQRFYAFIEVYLSKLDERYDTFKCKLYEDFRCGLVHEAIMKKGTGIFRSDDPKDEGYQHLEIYDHALWLDLKKLEEHFLTAAKAIKHDFDEDKKMQKTAISRLEDLEWSFAKEK